jgi:hypothetical protein
MEVYGRVCAHLGFGVHCTRFIELRVYLVLRMRADAVQKSFGGPPVHFQILHRRFVDGVGGKTKWIDEQTVSHRPSYESVASLNAFF